MSVTETTPTAPGIQRLRAHHYTRQLGIVRPDELDTPVHLIGCGGIGSPTAMALAKMGCRNLTLWDGDDVETHNLPNQLFRLDQLGCRKAEALAQICRDFTGYDVQARPEYYTDQPLEGIVVVGVDSLEVRQAIWRRIPRDGSVRWYVDARMGAQILRVWTIDPTCSEDVAAYDASFRTPARREPCTARSIIYTVFGAAALLAQQVKRLGKGEPVDRQLLLDFRQLGLYRLGEDA